MKRVPRIPARAPGRAPSLHLFRLLQAPAALALALALLATLAPLGTAARAQGATKGQQPPTEDGPVYVIHQTPDGEISCRLASPGEIGPFGNETPQGNVVQLNHLPGKESVAESASAGLTIILLGEPRLEQPENAQAKQAFINAAAKWETLISTQITVSIRVDYGPDFFGQPYSSSSTLGATSSGGYNSSYAEVRQRLINRAPADSEEGALLNNLPAASLPTDIGNVSSVFVPTAQARALGIISPAPGTDTQTAPVPRIGFNSNFSFDFNPEDGVNAGQTDFDSVAVHEIGHALGFISDVGRGGTPRAAVWDFYRFRPGAGTAGTFSSAPRVLSPGADFNDPHVHFSGAGELPLSTGRPDGTGGDEEQASHWKDDRLGGLFVGIMDPTIPRGRHEEISPNDLRAIDFFGYSVGAIPEPPNNHFANAQTLPGASGRVTGTNLGATSEAGEPNHSPDGRGGGKSVWYSWAAPATGTVTFSTGQRGQDPPSTFDTVLAAYTGSSVGALTLVANNDDVISGVQTSHISFTAVAGTTYRIAVDGWRGDQGRIALHWNQDGASGTVQLSSAAYSAGESAGRIDISVTRTGGTGAFSVNYSTSDGTATSIPNFVGLGADYQGAGGRLDFAVGETTKTFQITILSDTTDEPDETVNITLSNPTAGAQLGTPATAVLTILDDDAPPTLSVGDAVVNERDAGVVNAVFTVTLSADAVGTVSVNYATADGTATAGADYTAASGALSFAPGERMKTVSVAILGDGVAEGSETFSLNLSGPAGATVADGQGVATIVDDDGTPEAGGSLVHFSHLGYSASESQRSALIAVTRSENLNSVVSVDVRTVDNPAAVPCFDPTNQMPGVAFARCDYATTIETITFGQGETQKTVAVPLIDDAHGEPTEFVDVALSNPTGGARLNAQPTVRLLIFSDEPEGQTGATNPVGGVPFFVRQHYLDFLSREPEAGEPWSAVLNNCANQFNQDASASSAGCDRIIVSYSFFGSPEFELKGRFAFRFYKVAFGRLPEYAEIVADMRQLTGATPTEVIAKRAAFPASFVQRNDFRAAFDSMSHEQFINTLMGRYNLQQITTYDTTSPEGPYKVVMSRQYLIDRLTAATFTRDRALRAIADSDEVSAAEFRPSFVAMQYYGYLRRTPEPAGFQAWLNYLNQNPQDSRTMVNGFLNSAEYRLRFGSQ